jgi:hypothetical protein
VIFWAVSTCRLFPFFCLDQVLSSSLFRQPSPDGDPSMHDRVQRTDKYPPCQLLQGLQETEDIFYPCSWHISHRSRALNLLAVSLFGTLKAVAATAVVSFSLWYFLNEAALRHLVAVSTREIVKWALIISAYIGAFLGTYAIAETWITGFFIYSAAFAGITNICLQKETKQLWNIINQIIVKSR